MIFGKSFNAFKKCIHHKNITCSKDLDQLSSKPLERVGFDIVLLQFFLQWRFRMKLIGDTVISILIMIITNQKLSALVKRIAKYVKLSAEISVLATNLQSI